MARDTHLSLRSLLDGTVRVEAEHLPVAGAWIDGDRLRLVGLDVEGWLGGHVALVPADRLTWDGGWLARVTREEVEAEESRLGEPFGALDLASLPPILTGPFGHTVSPLMIAAGMMAEGEDEAPPRPPGAADEAETPRSEARSLPRAGDWLGLPIAARHDVIGRGAEAGPEVADLLIDAETFALTHLVVDTPAGRRAVPMEHAGEPRDGTVALALTRAEIDAMPEIATPAEMRRDSGLPPRAG